MKKVDNWSTIWMATGIVMLATASFLRQWKETAPSMSTASTAVDNATGYVAHLPTGTVFGGGDFQLEIQPPPKLILWIDKDGDIFLRGKWIGWDGRLAGIGEKDVRRFQQKPSTNKAGDKP